MGRFFVPVARVRTCCSLVFGKELFTDCSLTRDEVASAVDHLAGRILGGTEIVRTTAPFFG